MVGRGVAEHVRAVVTHGTAARVQKSLRRLLYDRIAALGPGTVGRQRSGALTLSLIVNEVVVNALKYAFPNGTAGNIVVSLASGEGDYLLSVADDGVGLDRQGRPAELDQLSVGQCCGCGLRRRRHARISSVRVRTS